MILSSAIPSRGPFLPTPAVQPDVPSGQPLELLEVLVDSVNEDKWVRFRYLAPRIGKGADYLSFGDVEADFERICEVVALPYLREYELDVDVVSIAMMDRPIEFGQADPEASQFVEVFRVSSGTCQWEGL